MTDAHAAAILKSSLEADPVVVSCGVSRPIRSILWRLTTTCGRSLAPPSTKSHTWCFCIRSGSP